MIGARKPPRTIKAGTARPHKVFVAWGRHDALAEALAAGMTPSSLVKEYAFETEAEVKAFRLALRDRAGHNGHTVGTQQAVLSWVEQVASELVYSVSGEAVS